MDEDGHSRTINEQLGNKTGCILYMRVRVRKDVSVYCVYEEGGGRGIRVYYLERECECIERSEAVRCSDSSKG